jgi:histidinol-phosphate phosphatase family protein
LGGAGFTVIIVTNQRGIATGQIKQANLEEMHSEIKEKAVKQGGNISDIYYCPHNILEDCDCRKPKAGMLLRVAKEHQLRLPECWMVGDSATDITAGKNAGCHTALITRSPESQSSAIKPDISVDSLASAVRGILKWQDFEQPNSPKDIKLRL